MAKRRSEKRIPHGLDHEELAQGVVQQVRYWFIGDEGGALKLYGLVTKAIRTAIAADRKSRTPRPAKRRART